MRPPMTDDTPIPLRWQGPTASWMERIRSGSFKLSLWVVAGLVAIGLVDWTLTHKRASDEQYRQTLHAEQVRAQLQSAMEAHVSALLALNVVYQNFVDINHQDFQQYGNSIHDHLTGFRRLMFLTPNAQIARIYPLNTSTKALLGNTLPSQFAPLLAEARTDHALQVSSLSPLLDQKNGVLAVIPIYREEEGFLGYAAGDLDLPLIWDNLQVEKLHPTYLFQLIDANNKALFPERGPLPSNASKISFWVGEHRWTLVVSPKPIPWHQVMMPHWLTWGLGLVILTLVLTLVVLMDRNREVLEKERRKFELVFRASPDGMVVLDESLQITLANPQIGQWLETPTKDLLETGFFDHFTCRCPHLSRCQEVNYLLCTSEQFQETLPETLEAEVNAPEANRIVRLNASKLPYAAHPHSKTHGFICVMGDISDQKEMEKVRESYVATLTHDLKTPLIAQDLVLENLISGQTGPISDGQNALLQGARASVRDLIAMVESTLLYYQLESQTITPHKQVLGLENVLQEVIDTLVPIAAKRDVTIVVSPALETVPVIGDDLLLKRLFHNLLTNAIRYARKGTPIRVLIEPAGKSHARITMINTGKGISAEELPVIFDKYHSFSRKFKHIGSGLGLYIARRIVGLHHGRIWAESTPDVETQFHVELPRIVSNVASLPAAEVFPSNTL